jgi:hypothetical protein
MMRIFAGLSGVGQTTCPKVGPASITTTAFLASSWAVVVEPACRLGAHGGDGLGRG